MKICNTHSTKCRYFIPTRQPQFV